MSDLGHTAKKFSFFFVFKFAVCPNLATRQRLHPDLPSAKIPTLGKASSNASAKVMALGTQICRVFWPKHSAKGLFAECFSQNTRQSCLKFNFIFVFSFSSCKSNTSHITHIAQISHISHKCLKYHIYHQTSPHITHIVYIYHHKSINQIKSTTKLTSITKQVHNKSHTL